MTRSRVRFGVVVIAGFLAASPAHLVHAQQRPQLPEDAAVAGELTYPELMIFLSAAGLPDVAGAPWAGADIAMIAPTDPVAVLRISDLEEWTPEDDALANAIAANGDALSDLHEAVRARPDLVELLAIAGAQVEDVVALVADGRGAYAFYVMEQ
jgi:hypothetical protein